MKVLSSRNIFLEHMHVHSQTKKIGGLMSINKNVTNSVLNANGIHKGR